MEIKKYEELKEEFVPIIEELLVDVQGFPETRDDYDKIVHKLAEFGRHMTNFAVGICILAERSNVEDAEIVEEK